MSDINHTKNSESDIQDAFNYTGNKGPAFGMRHKQVLLMGFGISFAFATKALLSIAIVAMTSQSSSNPDVPVYDWDNTSVIISAILWSGIPVNLLAGYLGNRYGPKWFTVASSIINHIGFMLIPLSAKYGGSTGVIACRLIQGVALGFLFPLNAVVVGRWVPPAERSRLGYLGGGLLTITMMVSAIATGYISKSYLGWPGLFYIFGASGLGWTAVYMVYGANGPQSHKTMNSDERKYLLDTVFDTETVTRTPWIQMFSSIHFWAVVMGITGFNWITVLLATEMSIFLAKVMKFDLETNGVVSALPPFLGMLSGVAFAIMSDLIPKRGLLSVVNSRRAFHIVGMTVVSLALVLLTYVPIDQKAWSVILLCAANIFVIGAAVGGATTNVLDVSQKYAGIISGFAQMVSQCVSLFAPLLVEWMCPDETDASQWRMVFLVSGLVSMGTTIFFGIFATDKRQNWDNETDTEVDIERRKRTSSVVSFTPGIAP